MFQVAVKTKRQQEREGRDRPEMPTQIAQVLRELVLSGFRLTRLSQGRAERQFLTAQDRLVKGMRVAEICTIEAANADLQEEFCLGGTRP